MRTPGSKRTLRRRATHMARIRTKVCSAPGCPTIHKNPGAKCDEHKKEADRQHWANTTGYNTAGHRNVFRPAVLTRDPICVIPGCNQPSEVADHYPRSRKELIELHLNPDDPQYGRGLCTLHHNQETAINQPGGWNQR